MRMSVLGTFAALILTLAAGPPAKGSGMNAGDESPPSPRHGLPTSYLSERPRDPLSWARDGADLTTTEDNLDALHRESLVAEVADPASLPDFTPSLTEAIEVPQAVGLASESRNIAREEDGLGRSWVDREHQEAYPQLPEPTSFLLVFTGVVGLFARRHLRRQHNLARPA